ncbi:MAG: hypothetical protein ACKVOL_04565 [Novosphingobium sp.]
MADARVGVAGKAFGWASGGACRGAGVQASLPHLAADAIRAAGWALLLSATAATAQAPPFTGVGSQFEMVFWQSVDTGADPALYEAYLSKYPNGTFAAVARAKMARLRQANAGSGPEAPFGLVPIAAPTPAAAPPAAPPLADPQGESPSVPRRTAAALTPPAPVLRPALQSVSVSFASIGPTKVASTGGPSSPSGQATSGPAPFVTDAVPTQGPSDRENSDALRRLLGALGDSQRVSSVSSQSSLAQSPLTQSSAFSSSAVTLPIVSAPIGQPASGTAPAGGGAGLVPAVSVQAASANVSSALPAAAATAVVAGSAAASTTIPHPIAVGPLPAGFSLPTHPAMVDVPGVALPSSFCSADARNAFHDGPYITAVEAAKRNNDAAIAYMHQLQDLYDRNQLSGDINPMNALAAEAQAYGAEASAAFKAQSALVTAFNALMVVPIIACDPPK